MRHHRYACLLLSLLSLPSALLAAPAGALTQQQVADRAAELYAQRLAELRASYSLDADAAFVARVRRIFAGLAAQTARDYPETQHWQWEIHASADPDQNADCMAGGKILVSHAYVQRFELNDAELAMLLAHEMMHAALRHNLLEYELAMRLDPGWSARPFLELERAVEEDSDLMARLEPLNVEQETQADRAGLLLASRAGWPPLLLASYFKKLARASALPNFAARGYPSPAQRWAAAREQAGQLSVR